MEHSQWLKLLKTGGYDPTSSIAPYSLADVLAPIGPIIEEVERTKLKQSISLNLKVRSIRKTDYVFLTINMDPSKGFTECFKAAQKLGNRKIWEWSTWVHEQRGDTAETAGQGHHVHMLAKIADNSAKTRAKSTVCHVCDVKNSSIFNFKYIPSEYILDKLQYITQSKALEKQTKQVFDKSWRSKNNISAIYYNATSEEKLQAAYAIPTEA